MNKGIIVIDIPKYCADCPIEMYNENFYGDHDNFNCPFEYKGYTEGFREERKAEWCPIRPVPERARHTEYCDNGRYGKGWNDCLDELLKDGG